MWYIIIALIAFTFFKLIKTVVRSDGWYEVIDDNNNSVFPIGKYNECKDWIKAQKGMDSLVGTKKSYRIIKKRF